MPLVSLFCLILIEKHTGKIYYSWLLILNSLAPTPSKTVEEFVKTGSHTLVKMLFENPTNRKLVFEIGSSRPDLISPA